MVRDTTRLFAELMRADPMVMSLAVQVLPDDAKQEFAAEWLATLTSAAAMNNNAAVEGVVAGWRSTAEIYADPELFAILTREHDDIDYGPVPPPEVPE